MTTTEQAGVGDSIHLDRDRSARRRGRRRATRRRIAVWVGAVLLIAAPAQSDLSLAFVRSGEDGQAILLQRLSECYAVVPEHVLGGDDFAALTGAGSHTLLGDGDLLRTFGYDLSVLRVSGALASRCGDSLRARPDLEGSLARNAAAVIHSVLPDGSIVRRPSTVVDLDLVNFRIAPSHGSELFKGLSGSVVTIRDEPAGFLMQVDPETGQGIVLRYDRALETIRPFFGRASAERNAGGPGRATSATGSERRQTSARDLATAANGGRVVSWSVEPVDGRHRAAHLIDAESGEATTWLVEIARGPVEIAIDLPGEGVLAIAGVELVATGVEPPERRPRDFELLVSTTEGGPWRPIGAGTFFAQDDRKTVSFAPTRARYVMLRIHSSWGDPVVGLSTVRVLAPGS
jgi:hypothetical protein